MNKNDEFEYFYTHMDEEVPMITTVTSVPEWANAIIITYFYHRPCRETQAIYKALGCICTQYWFHELDFILNKSRWKNNEEFRSLTGMEAFLKERGLYEKHIIDPKEFHITDRTELLYAFCSQLGMHWSIFPFTVKDFASPVNDSALVPYR